MMFRKLHISFVTLVGSDKDVTALNENHVITGPIGQSSSNPKQRKMRNASILAVAFQNAWKQGNLTAEVSQ